MRLSKLKHILTGILLVAVLAANAQALAVPPLTGRINDYAHLLSAATAQTLEQKLAAFERETSNQVVLLTVPSLDDETIEGFAIKVGDAWKIGQKDKGNGVILILAQKEHKIRIEVGTGLQAALPDITASQIIRTVMVPRLKAGDFDAGITAGLDAVLAATKGEFKATPADRKPHTKSGNHLFTVLLVIALVFIAAAGSTSRIAGAVTGGVALPVAAALGLGSTLWQLGLFAVLGVGAGFLISLFMGNGPGGGGIGGGGWGGGPTIFYGGGGGSSSGGGGGFEGGGGDFDGGGSSDDW